MQYQPALRPDQVKALYHLKVALRRPMTKLARAAVDSFLTAMKHKEAEALRAGTSLSDWLEYEKEMEEASNAAKLSAGLNDANALF
jgi:2-oxo-4-hydroxy-4-carboxy--5-ureidoimidazoline (OHCU) decarboxylase